MFIIPIHKFEYVIVFPPQMSYIFREFSESPTVGLVNVMEFTFWRSGWRPRECHGMPLVEVPLEASWMPLEAP